MDALPRKHAVIAGTGRAGTTFLVKFLHACGLDTGEHMANLFPRARAGLEHRLDTDTNLPYVVKDPWLFTYYDRIDLRKISIDALILPMRDIMSAAKSRVYQERVALTERSLTDVDAQVVGSTPGGVLYSLDVVDQARILGVGFHNVLHWAVVNELHIFLLSFPQLIEDCDYLLRALSPWLGEHCEAAHARKAFVDTADAADVRIDPSPTGHADLGVLAIGEPNRKDIAHMAMAERVRELTADQTRLKAQIEDLIGAAALAQRRENDQRDAITLSEQRVADAEKDRGLALQTVDEHLRTIQRLRNEVEHLKDDLAAADQRLRSTLKIVVWRIRRSPLYRIGRQLKRTSRASNDERLWQGLRGRRQAGKAKE